ncbi:MAG: type VI secretion system tube protein TssD [Terriglobia bacterium]
MSRLKLGLFIAAVVCLLLPLPSQAASVAYVKIEGTKQGTFKGESAGSIGKDWIAVLAFSYEVKSPQDATTGQASGKRQHNPVVITKQIDSTSPQIYQAIVNNEVLTRVTIEFLTPQADGTQKVYYTITLTNVTVTDVHQHMDQLVPIPTGTNPLAIEPMEDVSFAFQSIEVVSAAGQTSALDSWTTP